jgi:hypothetical protein
MEKIVVLYDKEDVIEFNNNNKHSKNVFLFSPGLEFYLKDLKNLNIYKPELDSLSSQKKIIVNSKKVYQEFINNYHFIKKFDKGIIENVHNILFISVFSFMYLIENLKNYENFELFYNQKWEKFDNFDSFIKRFIEKIFKKKNQGFFNYLRPKKISRINKVFIEFNNIFFNFLGMRNIKLVVGSLLTKKIFDEMKDDNIIVQIKPAYDFKIYHIFLNIFSIIFFFKRKRIFYFFPLEDNSALNNEFKESLKTFFSHFHDQNFCYFKDIIFDNLLLYCENQLKTANSISKIINFINPKFVFVDQLRFGVATMLASICNLRNIDVILVPHGSISVPDGEFSEFVLPICARGLIYSKIANYSVAQSKISYEAIRYYDSNLKVLKSNPLLFGKINLSKKTIITKNFIFLHTSTPKSLSKWPWIYENYNEYVKNINDLIKFLKVKKNVELLIRFREGPECDLKTFKKLINIEKNTFVKISKKKSFLDDLKESDCLISFSSTSIEETLFLNKLVLIYSRNKDYKHINYKFSQENDIYYANEKNIINKLDKILDKNIHKNYDILWNNKIKNNENFKELFL